MLLQTTKNHNHNRNRKIVSIYFPQQHANIILILKKHPQFILDAANICGDWRDRKISKHFTASHQQDIYFIYYIFASLQTFFYFFSSFLLCEAANSFFHSTFNYCIFSFSIHTGFLAIDAVSYLFGSTSRLSFQWKWKSHLRIWTPFMYWKALSAYDTSVQINLSTHKY